MGGLEFGLIGLGLLCVVISFFLSEKLSATDINEFEKMSRSDINVIVEKQLKEADDGIRKMVDDGMTDAMNDFDIKTDQLLNKKISNIADYSDGVIESIQKSHKEIIFMYNMLIEKQELLTQMTKDIQMLESNLRQMKVNLEQASENSAPGTPIDEEVFTAGIVAPKIAVDDLVSTPAEPLDVLVKDEILKQPDAAGANDKIIKMHNEGYSEVEIAKALGRGLGEIKLVLGLFNK